MMYDLTHKIKRKWMKLRLQPIRVFCFHHVCAGFDAASIADHVVRMGKKEFLTEDKILLKYVQSRVYFPRLITESISFSIPSEVVVPEQCTLLFLDGDSFC